VPRATTGDATPSQWNLGPLAHELVEQPAVARQFAAARLMGVASWRER
jgi:hypothetical protein